MMPGKLGLLNHFALIYFIVHKGNLLQGLQTARVGALHAWPQFFFLLAVRKELLARQWCFLFSHSMALRISFVFLQSRQVYT